MNFDSPASRCRFPECPSALYKPRRPQPSCKFWKDIHIVWQAEKYTVYGPKKKAFSYEVSCFELILELNLRYIETVFLKPRPDYGTNPGVSEFDGELTVHSTCICRVKLIYWSIFYHPFWFMLSAYCTLASLSFDRISRASRWDKPWNSSKSSP